MLTPNTILRERYRIIHQLGHGGMGAVYQAMDENLSCVVAVKETFATTEEQRRAFRREAELLANLSHATLPRVMDHFTDGDGQFLVMQFVPGHDLAELLELREQPFAVAKVAEWADQLLDALEELHASEPPIVHRDIKPANLKVTPKGKVLLLDFGLAKGVAGQMSTAGLDSSGKSIYGYTPSYAPLEQIRGRGTDARSDLYALAATLWTLLTGDVPPDALSRVAEKEDGNPDPLRSAREINPQVPESLSNLLQRALSLNRNQRPATATEFRNDLQNVRQAAVENATMPLNRPKALESTSLPPAPPLDLTIRASESSSQSSSSKQHLPTMRVESPPAVPTREDAATPSTAASLAPEYDSQRKTGFSFHFRWGRIAFIVAGLLVMTTSVIVWRTAMEKPTGLIATAPSQRNNANMTSASSANEPAGMVHVPGGQFMIGRDDGDDYERPAHQVTVKPFFMDQYEVTNEDYRSFIAATGHQPPLTWIPRFDERVKNRKLKANYPLDAGRKPVTDVTWDDANAYAKWAGKRLPTEAEWEFAARGTDGRRYPWGNDWNSGNANADGASKTLADVGSFKGASPFGVYDMVGNAWEWTATKLAAYPGGQLSKQMTGDVRVIRGGSYAESKDEATTTYRRGYPARGNYDYANTGFRCVKDLTSSSQ